MRIDRYTCDREGEIKYKRDDDNQLVNEWNIQIASFEEPTTIRGVIGWGGPGVIITTNKKGTLTEVQLTGDELVKAYMELQATIRRETEMKRKAKREYAESLIKQGQAMLAENDDLKPVFVVVEK